MRIHWMLVGALSLAGAAWAGDDPKPTPRVAKAVALAEGAAERAQAVEGLVSRGAQAPALAAELKPLTKELQKARVLAEGAAADADDGIAEAAGRISAALNRAEETLSAALEKAPEGSKAALAKVKKEAVRSSGAVGRLAADISEGKIPLKKDPMEVFSQPSGSGYQQSPPQEAKTGKKP